MAYSVGSDHWIKTITSSLEGSFFVLLYLHLAYNVKNRPSRVTTVATSRVRARRYIVRLMQEQALYFHAADALSSTLGYLRALVCTLSSVSLQRFSSHGGISAGSLTAPQCIAVTDPLTYSYLSAHAVNVKLTFKGYLRIVTTHLPEDIPSCVTDTARCFRGGTTMHPPSGRRRCVLA